MRLTLAIHPVSDIRFVDKTALDGSTLSINEEELCQLLLEDDRLEGVDIDLVRAGEACRFGGVYDVVEPRAKEPGDGSDFPGVLGPVRPAGRGTTHVLRGAAVSVLQDGAAGSIIEMSGEWAKWCPFSNLNHIVVAPHPRAGLIRHTALNALRLASVKTATYLARTSIGKPPKTTEVYESEGPAQPDVDGRPRLVYIGQVHSRQRVAEVDEQIVYGANTNGMVPIVLHPNEWLDGGILAGNAGGNITTFFYQNHPIITELYEHHNDGRALLVGTIATMAGSDNFDRELNCMLASELAKWALRADGAVLSKAGGGAPHADMGLTAKLCEDLGIRTVVQVGPPNSAPERTVESATLFNYPEVDAVVFNAGGAHTKLPAAPVERVIASSPSVAESLFSLTELPAARVCGVTSQQGAQRLRSFVR